MPGNFINSVAKIGQEYTDKKNRGLNFDANLNLLQSFSVLTDIKLIRIEYLKSGEALCQIQKFYKMVKPAMTFDSF